MLVTAAATAAISTLIGGIAKALDPATIAGGVYGNEVTIFLNWGLRHGSAYVSSFLNNLAGLDAAESAILQRAIEEANFLAIQHVMAKYASEKHLPIRTSGSNRGLGVLSSSALISINAVIAGCDDRLLRLRHESASTSTLTMWTELVKCALEDITSIVGREEPLDRHLAQLAWKALSSEFPLVNSIDGLRALFDTSWFDFLAINFQQLSTRPPLEAVVVGRLFCELRDDRAQTLTAKDVIASLSSLLSPLLAETTTLQRTAVTLLDEFRSHDEYTRRQLFAIANSVASSGDLFNNLQSQAASLDTRLRTVETALAPSYAARRRERLIGLGDLRRTFFDTDQSATELLEALQHPETRMISLVAPPGFGKSSVFQRAMQLAMPTQDPQEASVIGIAMLDARVTTFSVSQLTRYVIQLTGKRDNCQPDTLVAKIPAHTAADLASLFAALREAGPLWLIIENAEGWLTGPAASAFSRLLDSWCRERHSAKLLLLSQVAYLGTAPSHVRLRRVEQRLLAGLSDAASVALLRKRLSQTRFDYLDDFSLLAFAKRLHRVPLALEQFAGYLRSHAAGLEINKQLLTRANLLNFLSKDGWEESVVTLVRRNLAMWDAVSRQVLATVVWAAVALPQEGVLGIYDEYGVQDASEALTRLTESGLLNAIDGPEGDCTRIVMHSFIADAIRSQIIAPDLDMISRVFFDAAYTYRERRLFRPAAELLLLTEKVLRNMLNGGNNAQLTSRLSGCVLNLGVTLRSLGQLPKALKLCDEAVSFRTHLVSDKGQAQLTYNTAMAYLNRSITLRFLDRLPEALEDCERAVSLRHRLVFEDDRSEFRYGLAWAVLNHGITLALLDRQREALKAFGEAERLFTGLISEGASSQPVADLARTVSARARTLLRIRKASEALVQCERAVHLFDDLILRVGSEELRDEFAGALLERARCKRALFKLNDALSDQNNALSIRLVLVEEEGRLEVAAGLVECYLEEALIRSLQNDDLGCFAAASSAKRLLVKLIEAGFEHLRKTLDIAEGMLLTFREQTDVEE